MEGKNTLAEQRHTKLISKRKAEKSARRNEPMLKWRMKIDVGTHNMRSDWPGENPEINPGMVIMARKSDLHGVMDKFDMISEDPDNVAVIEEVKQTMSIEHVGRGMYKIKGPDGKYISDETMTKEDAEKIVQV